MKEIPIKVVYKGVERTGTMILLENLQEAVKRLGEDKVYRLFLRSYKTEVRNRIKLNRKERKKTFLKLKLKDLNDQQIASLKKIGLLDENS